MLTLAKRVEVINAVEEGFSHRAAAEKFSVGRTQVNNIILQKDRLLREFN